MSDVLIRKTAAANHGTAAALQCVQYSVNCGVATAAEVGPYRPLLRSVCSIYATMQATSSDSARQGQPRGKRLSLASLIKYCLPFLRRGWVPQPQLSWFSPPYWFCQWLFPTGGGAPAPLRGPCRGGRGGEASWLAWAHSALLRAPPLHGRLQPAPAVRPL